MDLRAFGAVEDLGRSMFGPWDKRALGRLGRKGRLKIWGIWPIWDSAHLEYYAHLLCHTMQYYSILFHK